MKFWKSAAVATAAAWIVVAAMVAAHAKVLAFAYNADGFDGFSADEVAIPLTPDGKTKLNFKTKKNNALVVITYNAECAVLGPAAKRLSIRIAVDGVNAGPPAGTNFAFCAATNNKNKIYVSVSRTVVFKVPTSGTHSIEVFGVLPDGANFASVDDTSIVVQD